MFTVKFKATFNSVSFCGTFKTLSLSESRSVYLLPVFEVSTSLTKLHCGSLSEEKVACQ